ncbi:MAG: CoA-binding protein [Cyclobacteriaceae bacterium]|nr:CoA-binding protein [Cyclobacteriaceae bacterium]
MKTLILGASTNPSRASFEAARRLKNANIVFVPVGLKKGEVFGEQILSINDKPEIDNVVTLTLYIGPKNQPDLYDYILAINPKRMIFNPGTENDELYKLATDQGIQCEYACTLVLLGTGLY